MSLAASVTDRILSLPGWLVLALVFAFPALEASAFVGFVFPGEIAVILGGVAASRGTVPLWAVIAAAVSGAIIGDSVGYLIGRRWGGHLLQGTVGRLPVIRSHLDKNLDSARAYVQRRKGSAVFFGRFTAALRVLVPGLAGISEVHYPTFLAYNVAGGTLWGAGFAVLGYVAGASYHRVEHIASQAGLILLGVIVAGLIASRLLRHFAARSRGLKAIGDRVAATPPLAWARRRFPAQVAWGRRRLDARSPRGFWLTFTVAAGALAAWAFGGLTQDVVGHDDTALADPHVTAWVIAHRTGWLTSALSVLTGLGSTAVIIPAGLAIGLYFLIRRGTWRPLALLAAAVAGAVGLSLIVKALVGRPRPPAAIWIGHYTGAAFPSGHATQSAAFCAMLVIVLSAGLSIRRRAVLWSAAALVVLIVGASRIYLGAHWLTDVLAGYALGATWVAIAVAVVLTTSQDTGKGSKGGDMSELAERKPFLLQPGQGESVWSLGGRFTAKATAADTEQRFALVESVAFQSTEPPLHIHHREDEAWYILDGKMTFYVADQVLEATAGCFAFAPRGIPHTFTVDVEPTRVLVFASPAGFEHFALELGQQARDDTPPANLAMPAPEVLGAVAERYGIEVVGPPARAR